MLVGCVYRTLYGLAVVAIWTAAASQWTATEAGVERTAQIGVGASLVVALVFVFGVLLRRSARSERQRKTDELERRWQERPAPITRPRHPDL